MSRTRQIKLGGKSRRFDIFGIGWNKGHLQHAAQAIRNSGYYARVIPTRFDKDIQAQRYAIFVRQKAGWNNYPDEQPFTNRGLLKHLDSNAVHAITRRGRPLSDTDLNRQGRTIDNKFDTQTWIFNRSKADAEWAAAIADDNNELDRFDYETAKRLKLSLKDYLDLREYGETEAIEDEESRGIYEEDEWWSKEGFWRDPLKNFSGSSIAAREKRHKEREVMNLLLSNREDTVAAVGTESPEDAQEYDEDDGYQPDAWSEVMDSIGYNDSAYRGGISPMVLMGYEGSGGEILSDEEYKYMLSQAENHKANARNNAEKFFSGSGRFGEFKEFAADLGIPQFKDIIALPIISMKWKNSAEPSQGIQKGSDGYEVAQPFDVNDIGNWYLHPKVQSTLFNLKYGTFTDRNEYAAEMAMLEHVFAGGTGSEIFTNAVQDADSQIDEQIDEAVLNMDEWAEGTDAEGHKLKTPELVVIGTDIGFFDSNGRIKGIRMTPQAFSSKHFDTIHGNKYPGFLQSLFGDSEDWNQEAATQVYWRGSKIWGGRATGGELLRDFEEYNDYDQLQEDVGGIAPAALTAAEISGIYFGNTRKISKQEAEQYLMLHATGDERAGGVDDRLYYNEEFLEEVKDRVSMPKSEWAKRHKISDWDMQQVPD